MATLSPVTEEQRAAIYRFHTLGLQWDEISIRTGVSRASVIGIVSNFTADGVWPKRDAELRALVKEGLTLGEIGVRMGLTKSAVAGRVNRLGIRMAKKELSPKKPSPKSPPKPLAAPERIEAGLAPLPAFHPLAMAILEGR